MKLKLRAGWKNKQKAAIYFDQDVLKILVCESGAAEALPLGSISFVKGWTDHDIAEEIKKALKKLRVNSQEVTLNLPRHLATIKNLTLPSIKPEEIASMVDFQVTRLVPYPKSEIVYSDRPLGPLPNQCTSVRVAVLPRKTVNHYLAILKEAHLHPVAIRLGSESTPAFLNEKSPALAIIEIDFSQTQVLFLKEGGVHFSRSIPMGFKDMNPKEEKSESYLADFLSEVEASMALFPIEHEHEKPPLLLTGASQILDFIEGPLRDRLKIDVRRLEFSPKLNLPLGDEAMSKVSFVHLLSVLKISGDGEFNLLPLDILHASEKAFYLLAIKKLLLAAGIALFLMCWSFLNEIRLEERYVEELKSKVKAIEKDAKSLELLKNKILILKDHIDARGFCLDILNVFLQKIPDQIYLKTLFYDSSKISFRGYAPALSKVFELTAILEKIPSFQKVETHYARQGNVGREEVAEFHLECTLIPFRSGEKSDAQTT